MTVLLGDRSRILSLYFHITPYTYHTANTTGDHPARTDAEMNGAVNARIVEGSEMRSDQRTPTILGARRSLRPEIVKTIFNVIKPPLATARAASYDGRVHLFVCLSPKCETRFSQKLRNSELRCPLTTYRKSHMGFSKNPLLDP